MGAMRAGKRALAMVAVMFAFASSVAYVIPNAQAVESPVSVAEREAAGAPQVLAAVGGDVAGATVARDGYGVTLPPPPPPPPPPKVEVRQASSGRAFTLVPSSSSAELQWPIAPGTPLVSGYGPRSCGGCSSYHEGADFTAPAGTPIWAMASGVVVETNAPGYSALGVHARIQHVIDGQVIETVYAHMTSGSLAVGVGDTVTAGQAIGGVGCTGSCTGNHLHFEVHPGGGAAVDPVAWLSSRLG